MTTLENMPDGLIPFPDPELKLVFLATMYIAIDVFATFSSLLIITAIYKAGPYQDSKFLLSLSIADLLYSISLLCATSLNLHYGAYALGKSGCVVTAGVTFVAVGSAVYSLMAMAINMYLVLIKRVYLADWQKDAMIIGYWTCVITVTASILPTDFRFKGMLIS